MRPPSSSGRRPCAFILSGLSTSSPSPPPLAGEESGSGWLASSEHRPEPDPPGYGHTEASETLRGPPILPPQDPQLRFLAMLTHGHLVRCPLEARVPTTPNASTPCCSPHGTTFSRLPGPEPQEVLEATRSLAQGSAPANEAHSRRILPPCCPCTRTSLSSPESPSSSGPEQAPPAGPPPTAPAPSLQDPPQTPTQGAWPQTTPPLRAPGAHRCPASLLPPGFCPETSLRAPPSSRRVCVLPSLDLSHITSWGMAPCSHTAVLHRSLHSSSSQLRPFLFRPLLTMPPPLPTGV